MTSTAPAIALGTVEARNVQRLASLEIDANPGRRTKWERQLVQTWGNGGNFEPWDFGQRRCRGCRAEIDDTPVCYTVGDASATLPVTVCDECMTIVRDHYGTTGQNQPAEVSLTPKWDEKCPPLFREVITGTVGMPAGVDRNAYSRVIAWRLKDGKGLAMVGAEGAGKSLSLWSLAREIEREGTAPVILTGIELGRVLAKAARDIEAIDWLCDCRVLMVDDLGKEKATPAVGALLWELLDRRYQHRRPVILTTRFSGEAMRDRFAEPHLGDDIRRRLNEVCVGVRFNP